MGLLKEKNIIIIQQTRNYFDLRMKPGNLTTIIKQGLGIPLTDPNALGQYRGIRGAANRGQRRKIIGIHRDRGALKNRYILNKSFRGYRIQIGKVGNGVRGQ